MREREMRQRIERFLQTRLRRMLAPATIGIGLAMTGCPSSDINTTDDGGALVNKDSGTDLGMVAVYSAPAPDASGTPANKDSGSPLPPVPTSDAGTDQLVTKYLAPVPDAGREASMPQPDYMAQMPDSGPVLRYMAQMPDAAPDLGRNVAIYMAQLPLSNT
jgi:hypothetical protein